MSPFGDFLPSVTNFSIQYNYACAGIATAIMLSESDMVGPGIAPDYPEPRWAKNFLLSIVFVGSIVGMLVMGALGDVIGLRRALVLANSFVVLGALASATLSYGGAGHVWTVIAASRFVLGIGVGGGYPLSAALAAESAQPGKSTAEAVKAFFWQGPGSLAPYLLALLLLRMPHLAGATSLQFRTLFAFGALPALVVVLASREALGCVGPASKPLALARQGGGGGGVGGGSSGVADALRRPEYWLKLVGTAGTWFLFDIALYSIVIFSPNILLHIFGAQTSLDNLVLRAATTALLATAGSLCGIAAVARKAIRPRSLNVLGFAAASLLFAVLAAVFARAPENHTTLFVLFCSVFVALYAGPQVGTFVMPVVSFPPDVRGTFGGISAASGKLGAMIGVLLFPVAEARLGMASVMALQAAVCFAAGLLSYFFLEDEDEGEGSETQALQPARTVDAGMSL